MTRLLPTFCVLLGIGIASAAAALPPPRSDRSAKVTNVACNVSGVWRGNGVDVAHTRWRFVLTLVQTNTAVEGAFDWHGSNGDTGREHIAGRVDCNAQRLVARGIALENAPSLALAGYVLRLNPSFSAFSGRWTGGIPGTLQATRDVSP